jgi:predicted dehydrogenase
VPLALVMARAMALVTKNPPLSVDNILGMNQPTDYDISAAEREIGFTPRPVREGIKDAFHGAIPTLPGAHRIVVVGLGRMGLAHAALLNTIPNVQLVGLCDLNPRLGKQAAGMGLRAPFYSDLARMLEEQKPDAAIICAPPHSHLRLARACVERNVGVLLEKPLAESLSSAEQIVGLLAGHPVVNAVGYQYAHIPVFRRAEELLRDGMIGRPLRGRASMYLSQVLGPKKASWWYDPAVAGGGVVISITSHLLLLLHRFFWPRGLG